MQWSSDIKNSHKYFILQQIYRNELKFKRIVEKKTIEKHFKLI